MLCLVGTSKALLWLLVSLCSSVCAFVYIVLCGACLLWSMEACILQA
jgi:hypothetical protein